MCIRDSFNNIRYSLPQEKWNLKELSRNAELIYGMNPKDYADCESDDSDPRDVEREEIRERENELADLSKPTPGTKRGNPRRTKGLDELAMGFENYRGFLLARDPGRHCSVTAYCKQLKIISRRLRLRKSCRKMKRIEDYTRPMVNMMIFNSKANSKFYL